MHRLSAICCFIILVSVACRKAISNPVTDQPPANFSEVFEDFWSDMNVNYLYWDIDTTNWDAVHECYGPLFAGLQLSSAADAARSVQYLRQICDGLIDRHYYVSFSDPFLADSTISPVYDHLIKTPGFHNEFSYLPLDASILDPGYVYGYDNVSDPAHPLIALSGTIHGDILFFSCNLFGLNKSFHSNTPNSVQPLLSGFFSRLQQPTGIKGVLLDMRSNPGGDISDLALVAGRFTGGPMHFGFTRYKAGNGRLDYTPWIDAVVQPQPGAVVVKLPIVIVADRYSASMAEIFTMAMRTLPNCKVVGETTFGATGPFTANGIYNDGSFDVTGFMSVQESSTEFKYIDGKIYEGKGFPPDYPVPYDPAALGALDDPQLDKAISLLE
jgi:carboxyl-terminal processing protease